MATETPQYTSVRRNYESLTQYLDVNVEAKKMADVDPTDLEVVNPTGGTVDVQLRLAVLCVVALCSSVKLRVRF